MATFTEKAQLEFELTGDELRVNQYVFVEGDIGNGNYAVVRKAHLENDAQQEFAIKIMGKRRLRKRRFNFGQSFHDSVTGLQLAQKEAEVLSRVNHACIANLIEVIDDEEQDPMYYVTEFCDIGCVMDWDGAKTAFIVPDAVKKLKTQPFVKKNYGPKKKSYGVQQCQFIIKDLASAVKYLHEMNIVHFDIKPANMLLTTRSNGLRMKLCDFGTARDVEFDGDGKVKPFSYYIGTEEFYPPEYGIGEEGYLPKPCDLWCIGVTMNALMTGKLAFFNPQKRVATQQNARTQELQFPSKFDDNAKFIIGRLLDKNPVTRMTIEELVQSDFLK